MKQTQLVIFVVSDVYCLVMGWAALSLTKPGSMLGLARIGDSRFWNEGVTVKYPGVKELVILVGFALGDLWDFCGRILSS